MSYKTILAILDTADNSAAVADFAFLPLPPKAVRM